MIRSVNWHKCIFLLLMLVFLATIVSIPKKSALPINNVLPDFRAIDSAGLLIDSRTLLGKKIFIQFINLDDQDDSFFNEQFIREYASGDIVVINVADRNNMINRLVTGNNVHYIFNNNVRPIERKIFPAIGKRFLYNEDHSLVLTVREGIFLENIKSSLNKHIKGLSFDSQTIIYVGQKIGNSPILSCLNKYKKINRTKRLYLVVLISSICDNCKSGRIVEALNELQYKYNDDIEIVYVIGPEEDRININSFNSQTQNICSIIISDAVTRAIWRKIIDEYGESEINGTAVIISNDLNVESVFSLKEADYFKEINTTIKELLLRNKI